MQSDKVPPIKFFAGKTMTWTECSSATYFHSRFLSTASLEARYTADNLIHTTFRPGTSRNLDDPASRGKTIPRRPTLRWFLFAWGWIKFGKIYRRMFGENLECLLVCIFIHNYVSREGLSFTLCFFLPFLRSVADTSKIFKFLSFNLFHIFFMLLSCKLSSIFVFQ